jgi:hypothetical protein
LNIISVGTCGLHDYIFAIRDWLVWIRSASAELRDDLETR